MNILFLVLYGFAAFMTVLSIQCNKNTVRFIFKICLMPVLLVFYIFNSDTVSFVIISAIIFSWCGDILLVKPKKSGLYAGVFSFLAAHILYVFMFIDLLPEINIIPFVFSILIIVLIECFLITKLQIQNNYRFPAVIYGIAIGFLVVFSLQFFIWYKNMAGIFFVTGSVSFFVSDTVLVYFNTIKIMTKNSFTVIMLCYIIAQACIVIGSTII